MEDASFFEKGRFCIYSMEVTAARYPKPRKLALTLREIFKPFQVKGK